MVQDKDIVATDGILHFVFVTPVAFDFNVLLHNITCCFHNDWNSSHIGSTRNYRNPQQQRCLRDSMFSHSDTIPACRV